MVNSNPTLTKTRYGYSEMMPVVPSEPEYMMWLHVRYANGTSLETMRQELSAMGRNAFEIELILKHIEAYVRDEMGLNPDNSRSAGEEALGVRCEKLAAYLRIDLDKYGIVIGTTPQASVVIPGGAYRVAEDLLVQWKAFVDTGAEIACIPELQGTDLTVNKALFKELIEELATRLLQYKAGERQVLDHIQSLVDDRSISILSRFNVEDAINANVGWL